jgi:threonylcarbamoyladenosine tRNA methylthiotransferase MtaB
VKYSILTFGCRVNQADSLAVAEDLRRDGAVEAPASAADVVVVNTCSVTASADQGARQAIRRVARDNPAARIVVTGCYATRCAGEVAALPGVVQVIPNSRKAAVAEAVAQDTTLATADRYGGAGGPCGAPLEPGIAGRTTFTLRVQTGCEEQCAYCIIPATRGRGDSLPLPRVLAEIERIVGAGFQEIVLTGVHLGSYGRDLAPPASLASLLSALAARRHDVLFRVSSLEPMDCTPEIVELIASHGCFAPHFHLPLQHGSDRMLQRMRRPYSAGYYRELVAHISSRLPHASIGSDVIAGFPGERDEDFCATLDYLQGAPLSHLHVFPYSDRPGTEASALRDKVPGPVIRERAAALRAAGHVLSTRFKEAQIGTVRPGLTTEDGTLVVTDNYLKVRIAPGLPRNQRVDVRLTSATTAVVVEA